LIVAGEMTVSSTSKKERRKLEEGWQGRQAAGIVATHSGGSAILK